MKLLNFIFITFSLCLFGCSDNSDPGAKQVDEYLSSHFSIHIDDQHIFCFIPANQCKNCFSYDGKNISPNANSKLIVISGFPAANFKNFNNFHFDDKDDMLQLKVLDYGNKLIKFHNGKISAVIPITDLYSQADSLAHSN